ncbi:GNAT family N-acetyltransferase [Dyadobacter arcticus]|uniref:GNAT superfamily N-acetyltransferase n=1 Tax=Dyadobacter arcticus TaxID=1078754 RepID=A0ABX0US63_9BACT|nr:GNAT family N-acetyltransferase [Dyadobacter arcticus]NIJ54759.1 GNAT superfamily N-acetyltransferase [Dyadobacter arcticus]
MNDILVRSATIGELSTLLNFEQGIIIAERPFDETLLPGDFNYYDLAKLIMSDEAEVVVAEIGGELVGSGHARILEGKPYVQFERYAFLGFMYVVPEQRGKGINKLIIKALVDWAKSKGLDEVRLHVYDENSPAIAAYEKVGFKKILTEMRLTTDI